MLLVQNKSYKPLILPGERHLIFAKKCRGREEGEKGRDPTWVTLAAIPMIKMLGASRRDGSKGLWCSVLLRLLSLKVTSNM
jgi:hypothetical protein